MEQSLGGPGELAELASGSIDRCLGMAIKAVRELPAPRSTSYALRRLVFDLADGRTLDVFLKDFGVSPHDPAAALRRGARERYVYETVLAARALGTAALYGVVWDDVRNQHWLLLEFVQGEKLRRHPIEDRIGAARWLGRLHGSVVGHEAELSRLGILLDYDEAYFHETAERALRAVGSRFGSLHRTLKSATASYEAVIDKICSAPPALVHGSYRPKNILLDKSTIPVRICPTDWELAALGPPLHDLAFIADGCDGLTIEKLCESYIEQAAALGVSVPGTDDMLEDLERLRLHKTLRSLARSAEWAYPGETVTKLVAKAETIRHRVG
jgi:aminoglycoside phosphotransferase (APT) family kinase protein